jgi:hypothetical protein
MLFPRKLFPILPILLLAGFSIHAQTPAKKSITKKDTTIPVDSSQFFLLSEDQLPFASPNTGTKITNQLDGFQNYYSREANLGNVGSPQKNLRLPGPQPDAFSRGPNYFTWFGRIPQDRHFYNSELPYSKLYLVLGMRQEQNVNVIHAHPFGKNCNVAFEFERVRSEGFYRRQNTNNTYVNLNGWYRSPGRRYALLGNVFWNGNNIAENGGIKIDDSFEKASQLDRQLVSINLNSASTRQRIRGAWVKQYWALGPVTDTLSEKTDSTEFKSQITPRWAIVNTIEVRDESYVFEDLLPASGFYENIYHDSDLTMDSTYLWRVENGLWLEKFTPGTSGLSFRLGARYEAGEIKNDTIYRHFDNVFLDGKATYRFDKFGDVVAKGWYVLNGFNRGDYKFESAISAFRSGIVFEYAHLSPQFVFTNYSGNHFRWQNDFSKSDLASARIYAVPFYAKFNMLMISAQWNNYYRPVFFNSDLLPEQFNGSVNAFSVKVRLDLGKEHFRTVSFITWNSVPASSPLRLPQLIVRESIYVNYKLFKSALLLQAGIDMTWYSSYYADGYDPNVAHFFVQDEKKIGNYLYLDPWVSLKIKPVRIFVKADHANAGLFGRTYYATPHHPGNDLSVKFGISWIFND